MRSFSAVLTRSVFLLPKAAPAPQKKWGPRAAMELSHLTLLACECSPGPVTQLPWTPLMEFQAGKVDGLFRQEVNSLDERQASIPSGTPTC